MQHRGKFTPAEAEAAGLNMTIWRAVQVAGGETHVAREFGMAKTSVRYWMRRGVPAEHREKLCAMGGHTYQPEQLAIPQGAGSA